MANYLWLETEQLKVCLLQQLYERPSFGLPVVFLMRFEILPVRLRPRS